MLTLPSRRGNVNDGHCHRGAVDPTDVTLQRMHLPRFTSSPLFAVACFLFLSAALYGNALFGGFIYDDLVYVARGALHDPSSVPALWLGNPLNVPHYRPLTFTTFALNFLLTGDSPVWFHAFSVMLNGIVAWLVFVLTLRLFRNRALAWCTALLFALLPIHTEAVAYIKARDEIFVAFFGLLAWIAFLRSTGARGKAVRAAYATVSAALSLSAFLSKESALVLPGVFGGAFLLMHGPKRPARYGFPLLLQAAAIALYFLLQQAAFEGKSPWEVPTLYFGQNPLAFMDRSYVPWTAAMLLFVVVSKTFVPWNLSATYGFAHLPPIQSFTDSWKALAGLALLLALLALIAHPRTRRTPLGVGALTFLILYFPFSKLVPLRGSDYFGERWLYAPSVGLSMIGAYALYRLAERRRRLACVLGGLVVVAYIAVLVPRNLVWRSQMSLGRSMLQSAPRSVVTYEFLARELLQEGRMEEASGLTGRGMQITRRHVPLHQVDALVALDMGDTDRADRAVTAAEELGRNELPTVILRSTVLATQRKFQEGLDHLLLCRTLNFYDHRVRFLLALNLWKLGRREEAEAYFDWDAEHTNAPLTREQKIWLLESF